MKRNFLVAFAAMGIFGCNPSSDKSSTGDTDAVITLIESKTYDEIIAGIELDQTISSLPGSATLQSCLATADSSVPSNPDITIWINSDKGYEGLQKLANCYAETSGNTVAVETPDDVTEKFQEEAAVGGGPDIFIWAHDRIGDWAQNNLLAEVSPSQDVFSSIPHQYWDSTEYEGKLYGYPLSVEGSTIIVNNQLVTGNTIDLNSAGSFFEQGYHSLIWDYNNTYFTYGWLNANGGYAFKKTSTGYDVTDTGVDHEGFITQGDLIRQLIEQDVMPEGVDYGEMDAAFKVGEAAMIINGPWAYADYAQAGIDYSVRGFRINGNVPRMFTGVLSATINANSTNKSDAETFIQEYLMTEAGIGAVDDDRSVGIPANLGYLATRSENENLLGLATVMLEGEPMPNVPEMGAFWSSMGPALTSISGGNKTARSAFSEAKQNILR